MIFFSIGPYLLVEYRHILRINVLKNFIFNQLKKNIIKYLESTENYTKEIVITTRFGKSKFVECIDLHVLLERKFVEYVLFQRKVATSYIITHKARFSCKPIVMLSKFQWIF